MAEHEKDENVSEEIAPEIEEAEEPVVETAAPEEVLEEERGLRLELSRLYLHADAGKKSVKRAMVERIAERLVELREVPRSYTQRIEFMERQALETLEEFDLIASVPRAAKKLGLDPFELIQRLRLGLKVRKRNDWHTPRKAIAAIEKFLSTGK